MEVGGIGGVEGGKTVPELYSMEEKSIFNKKMQPCSKQCIWYILIVFQLYLKKYVVIKCGLTHYILRNTKEQWNVPHVSVILLSSTGVLLNRHDIPSKASSKYLF